MRRLWIAAAVVAAIGVLFALILLGWMADETHFDRPSEAFDDVHAQIEGLPGVESVEKERWVEAPTFADPTSWMSVTVDQAGLPGLIEAACAADYADPISWSIRVRTPAAATVSLHATPAARGVDGTLPQCPDFGFDAVRVVEALDRTAPGLAVQPSTWSPGRFVLVAVDEGRPAVLADLLPLVEHADDLVAAAGPDMGEFVEINSADLGLVLGPGEGAEYRALLTALVDDHGVTSFWADTDHTGTDEEATVQIVAPAGQRAEIEESIRASSLPVARFTVRFLEQ
ncbi:hypothetical protein [Microbacterium sp. HJ5]